MSGALFGANTPRSGVDRLVVYVLGAGVGESQVLLLPDGRCVVVDSCMQGGVNLTASLLSHLGVSQIHLLVFSHPDLDHLRGLAELVKRFSPTRIWRYPFAGYVRDLVAHWARRDKTSQRLKELHEALKAIDDYSEAVGDVIEANHSSRRWPHDTTEYEVQCLAPTSYDQGRVRKLWQRIIDTGPLGEPKLAGFAGKLLRGEAKLPLAANVLSLALAIRWKNRKLLLAGDVENGNRSPHSGWKGAIAHADRDGYGPLLRELDLIKVAHHGSRHSFYPPAWDRHRKPDDSTLSVLAPFTPTPLPADLVLKELLSRSAQMGISACDAGLQKRVEAAGWKLGSTSAMQSAAPFVAVVLKEDGSVDMSAGGQGRWFIH
ncbi:MBL fold metallo-hydrolase [Hyalangium versicolor]|uniref:MBL fold metallo-hydrolase n=1 Tax=Hyalangium versicolor TaxID=2861190 RepID=UPI001CCCB5B8|nr:MBL fold metallo-hydrolase [Hyalangium versicolor]